MRRLSSGARHDVRSELIERGTMTFYQRESTFNQGDFSYDF